MKNHAAHVVSLPAFVISLSVASRRHRGTPLSTGRIGETCFLPGYMNQKPARGVSSCDDVALVARRQGGKP